MYRHEHMRNVNQRQSGLHGARFLVGNKIRVELDTCSLLQLVLYSHALDPAHGTHCCSPIYVQESICTIFDRKSVSTFCCELELKQSEIRLPDEMFMQRYSATL
jgi:hypothetical protein